MQQQVHHTSLHRRVASSNPMCIPAVQDVASACGIRAMPTFQAYFGGQKVAELSGADPRALEDMIKRCDPSNSLMKHETLVQLAVDTGSGAGSRQQSSKPEEGVDTGVPAPAAVPLNCSSNAPECFAWTPEL